MPSGPSHTDPMPTDSLVAFLLSRKRFLREKAERRKCGQWQENVAREKERHSNQQRRDTELNHLRREAARKRRESVSQTLPFAFQTYTDDPFADLPDTFDNDFKSISN